MSLLVPTHPVSPGQRAVKRQCVLWVLGCSACYLFTVSLQVCFSSTDIYLSLLCVVMGFVNFTFSFKQKKKYFYFAPIWMWSIAISMCLLCLLSTNIS